MIDSILFVYKTTNKSKTYKVVHFYSIIGIDVKSKSERCVTEKDF